MGAGFGPPPFPVADTEPDNTPVTPEHVAKFLAWYRTQCRVPHYLGMEDHWCNALHTLTLGELRNGVRTLKAWSRVTYLDPPRFWQLCKKPRTEETERRFNRMRQILRSKQDADT